MKIDLDSILYIVLTIAILAISALGSRRKKKLLQQQASVPPSETGSTAMDSAESRKARIGPSWQQPAGPLERLEQILSGDTPVYESMEGESLETVVDEEEQILQDLERSRQEGEKEPEVDIKITGKEDEAGKRENKGLPTLFGDVDEVKKAIIYSEIMNRRYD